MANYPFATVEPNIGVIEVPDERLGKLALVIAQEEKLSSLPPLVPAVIKFVDIAGLVKGAAEGEGLGNQFLANIRETDLICHVLRDFTDPDVVVTGKLDPAEDLQIIRTELILKDLETVSKQERDIKKINNPSAINCFKKTLTILNNGQMINQVEWNEQEQEWLNNLFLLTAKPEIFVINVSEDRITQKAPNKDTIIISAKIESELASLDEADQLMYLNELGLKQAGIERMAQAAYKKLGLVSFLTAGEIECRAWTIKAGIPACQAAGVIHTDFEKKFIKAKVISFDDFIKFDGWKKAADAGRVRQEGRDYQLKDGDVVEFAIGK